MKKEKLNQMNKGITLIALIITIIVMLILVGVTITVAIDGGLLSKAKEAGTKYEQAAQQDEALGLQAEYEIAKATGEFTGSYDAYLNNIVLETQYGLKIGDKVTYQPRAYESGDGLFEATSWRVLGINEAGEVELFCTVPDAMKIHLEDEEDYLNAETIIKNEASNEFLRGEVGIDARGITVEDINKLSGYTPDVETKYTYKYYEGSIYGIASSDITEANKNNVTDWYDTGYEEFYSLYWTLNETNVGAYELENSSYTYNISDKLKMITPDNKSLIDIITTGEDGYYSGDLILCSLYNYSAEDWIETGVRKIMKSDNSYILAEEGIFDCESGFFYGPFTFHTIPVVTLPSETEFEDINNDGIFEIKL